MEGSLFARVLLALTTAALLAGVALQIAGEPGAADAAWAAGTVVALVPLVVDVIRDLVRRNVGVDLIALLAMGGAVALRQYVVGSVIAVMLASGRALEGYASTRANRELSSLLSRAPHLVHRYEDGRLTSPPIDDVRAGDLLLVKPGEILPVDGVVASEMAVLDESAITGESRPAERGRGDRARSGAVNAGSAFDLRAVATAEESTYAGIVRLVREAQEQKAPFVRLADRYALLFIPFTLTIAGLAWAVTGDSMRALAVLVVATPCPLILAAPIAIVSGISRAAHMGVIVKDGGALETLARGRVLLFDKTGTLTAGSPRLASVDLFGSFSSDDVVRLAASLDQVSPHVLAAAIVRASRERGLLLTFPSDVVERPGAGIRGSVDGRPVRLGSSAWVAGRGDVPSRARETRRRAAMEGSSNVFVGIDGEFAGALVLDDPIRPDTPRAIRALRRAGIERVVMVTGDHPDVAETVGAAIGADAVLAERSPEEKVAAVQAECIDGVTIMVGDGINDAPALAAADVGVAMGARGATASSETADVVVMVDRLDRLVTALRAAQRSRAIALQSVLAGMGLSCAAMVAAAFGQLPPIAGAILQEAIDVAVILNALRALYGDGPAAKVLPAEAEMGRRYRHEHRSLLPMIDEIRLAADGLGDAGAERAGITPGETRASLDRVQRFLVDQLLPHERAEEATVYPAVSRVMGGEDPMASMSRAHMEIGHLARVYGQLLDGLPPGGLDPDDVPDLRRVLYGLHAVLKLHFAQEEEAYLFLVDEAIEANQPV